MPLLPLEAVLSAPARPLPAYPTLKESWGFLGWYLLIMMIVGIPTITLSHLAFRVGSIGRLVVLIANSPVVILCTIWWLRRRAGPMRWPTAWPQLHREQWKLYWLLPVIVLAHITLLTPLHLLHLADSNATLYREMAKYPWLVFVFGCVAAPVFEELLFRGILLKGLLRNYRPAVAIGQSALLFGIMHFSPAQSLAVSFTGLLLGWLYYRTRSLKLCISLHALNNLLAFSAMRSPKANDEAAILRFTSTPGYLGVLLLAALVLAGCVWWVQRTTTAAPGQGQEYDLLTTDAV